MIEEWRDIKNYEGVYQISSLGRIRSLDRYVEDKGHKRFVKGKILKPFPLLTCEYLSKLIFFMFYLSFSLSSKAS